MGVFIQAPFWATGYRRRVAPHATSVLVTAPVLEPLTLVEAIARAGLTGSWTPGTGDARDSLFNDFIAAARAKVEQDSGLALLTQTRDVYLDAVYDSTIVLPPQSTPLQSVTSVKTTDTAGVQNTLDPTTYVTDLFGARIALSQTGYWPTDLRTFQPWVIRIVAGYTTVAALKAAHPLIVHAVGLLVAHYATAGRDLVTTEAMDDVPHGYEDALSGYQPIYVM
jgi:uncharacterized phiE125 gp8 family phage protein